MAQRVGIGISATQFRKLAATYRRRWGIGVTAADREGRVVFGGGSASLAVVMRRFRQLAINEALRWGEPTVQMAPDGVLLWAAPLMHNARLLGGVVAQVPEHRLFPSDGSEPAFDSRAACAHLRELVEEANLTNAALLAARRDEYAREQDRAEAIHSLKGRGFSGMDRLYLLDEPALVAAIRKGDRREARGLLNRLLLVMHAHAGDRLDLIKSFFMELVVTLSRIAVEAGADAQRLLGTNFTRLGELAELNSEERLAPWLHEMLERLMDSIESSSRQGHTAVLAGTLRYMSEHLADDLSRDQAARQAQLSPAHFSRLFERELGRTFTDMLNQMRVDRACQLLARTSHPLKQVALECGFRDQSYFTKVFRRHAGRTPRQYRRGIRLDA